MTSKMEVFLCHIKMSRSIGCQNTRTRALVFLQPSSEYKRPLWCVGSRWGTLSSAGRLGTEPGTSDRPVHLKELCVTGPCLTKRLLYKLTAQLVEALISLLHPNFDVTDKSIIDNAATMSLGKCF